MTTVGSAAALVLEMRTSFESGQTRSLAARRRALSELDALIVLHESELLEALAVDLGKSRPEGWLTELALSRQAIRDLARRLPAFMRPTRVKVPLVQRPGSASVKREPRGCSLVISAWNYPVMLLLIPVATAIAAGNVVIAKPSELAPATSSLLAAIFDNEFDRRILRILEGGPEATQAVIAAGVDHVFFTGSSRTGRAILQAAAPNLTPVTLELGGKSPAFVDRDADLPVAARRIAFAKFLNAGQTCVSPDYVLVHAAVAVEFETRLKEAVVHFYGERPRESPDLSRIINQLHFDRLVDLVEQSDGEVLLGGGSDASTRFIEPTLIVDPSPNSALMQEEIFGPILPVVRVRDVDDAIREIISHPAPLSIYCFTRSRQTVEHIAQQTRSGGVTQNTAAEQFGLMTLPFGGVGESGIGAYHGGAGLEEFSQLRSYLRRGTHPESRFAYPPSTPRKLRILRRALRA